ncbi:MAG: hypothetical protein AUH42_00485 [Gemmatimonadetes bacterium 13_1_40CM_70_11]|nr:MAG: hypothetical protein AUH42_00485 [Gemmatimonadetes bacterium 13_1_40CM_70_11]
MSGETGRTQPVEVGAELEGMLREDVKGEFVVERLLGRGGMAAVYLARDPQLDRKVAIKVLPPELTFGAGMVERFKREARTAATLDHPLIVPIYKISTGGKLFWYAMKFIEGESLADVLARENLLAFPRAARILAQVAEALQFAHEHAIIHRDVKPANIMLGGRDRVTVTDFGIAKAMDTSSLTGSGSAIGTPYYMSPEQCSGKGVKLTGAADQYSLGVVAYQMVSGHLPFTGESVFDIIKQHCFDPVPPLAALRADIPPMLVAVVERALAKTAGERFASVTEFSEAFTKAARGELRALPPRATPAERAARLRPKARGRRAAMWGVATLALAGGLTLVLWPRAATQRPEAGARAPAAGNTSLVAPKPAIARVRLEPQSLDLKVGETGGLTLAAFDSAGASVPAGRVDWSSGNRRIAAIDSLGMVTALAPGTVVGRATRDGLSDSAVVRVSAGATAAANRAPRNARLVLRGVRPGSSIVLDGQTTNDTALSLRPGERHVVFVILDGYVTWLDTLRPRQGEQLTATVEQRLLPVAQAAPPAPVVLPPSTPAPAYLTVGSRPLAEIRINGRITSNPVANSEVPSGEVRIHFEVTDASGRWTVDTTVTLAPGEHRNLGRIPLVRRP